MEDSRRCSGTVYFSLVTMALCCLAACILIPEWRKLQALDLACQIQQHEFAMLQQEVAKEKHLLMTLQSDPAAVKRLAQRQLNLTPPDRTIVAVSTPMTPPDAQAAFIAVPRPLPPTLSTLGHWYDRFDLDRVFRDRKTRPILLVMSVGLIVVAVVLSCRRVSPPADPSVIRLS